MEIPARFESGELVIECAQPRPELLRLDWKGRSHSARPGDALTPYLSELIDRAKSSQAALEMHFEALEFFNSSTVAVLVQMLQRARAAGVRLALTYQPSLRWQKLSFEALRVFEHFDRSVQIIPLAA
jgi:hypothetical protein